MARLLRDIDAIALGVVWAICSAVVLTDGAYLLWLKAFWPATVVLVALLWPTGAARQTALPDPAPTATRTPEPRPTETV